ncbi:GntR family transcriptional regulator [Motiliproteus sp.]|uniref:GntR family transcriptional regulator n=1 Tax=Motiliproteus sp. TaxID=1898955 RepID=UPI003BA964E7
MPTAKPHVSTQQVIEYLSRHIRSGEWSAESKLPSERGISEQLQTSRVTVREALKRLESDGLIYRSNRRGWFVTSPKLNYDPSRDSHFAEYALEQGFTPFTRELSRRAVCADNEQATDLQVAENSPLVVLDRLRGIDGRPLYLEQILLRSDLFDELLHQPLDQSLTQLWRQHYRQRFSQVKIDISIASLNADQAQLLQAPVGGSCFLIRRRTFNQDGILIEYDREYWRHDALNIQFSQHR